MKKKDSKDKKNSTDKKGSKDIYYLLHKEALPEVYVKVMHVKDSLEKKEYPSINQAVKDIGISRSAYYKYRNSVFEYNSTEHGKVIFLTVYFEPIQGILVDILTILQDCQQNILSINQNLPVNGISALHLTLVDQEDDETDIVWQSNLRKLIGVRRIHFYKSSYQ